MNSISTKALTIAGIMIIMFSMSAVAQEGELPDPGITPDSPLYGLDKAMESIQNAFNSGDEDKSRYGLNIAEERLAEAKAMSEKGNYELAKEMSNEYENQIENTIEIGKDTSDSARKGDILEIISNATTSHQLILERVRNDLPKPAQDAINNSLKASKRGREKSLDALGNTNPAKAAKIHFEFANNRINSIKGNASEEKLVNELISDYADEMNKTQILIEEANNENMNVTELEERVANATSRHLTVLQNVHDKVPEPAKASINHAMNVSIRGQQRALENLQNKKPQSTEEIENNIPDFAKSKNTTETANMKSGLNKGKNINITNTDDSQQTNETSDDIQNKKGNVTKK